MILALGLGGSFQVKATTAGWNDVSTLSSPRSNPYALPESELTEARRRGSVHAQVYPVTATGALPPYEPIRRFVEDHSVNPLRTALQFFFRRFVEVRSLNDVFRWVGLHEYPRETDEGIYSVPYPGGTRPKTLMGFGLVERNGATGFTLSCAACHSANLFGKTVLGMTNRFPRANEAFRRAAWASRYYDGPGFEGLTHATTGELALMQEAHDNLRAVGVRRPVVLGLDTSLAQVALSLDRRNADADATRSRELEKNPTPDLLAQTPADSKPAVWWNLKYKTRWLSDGSVVSGNPVFTNILWNEIGRGADLAKISDWLDASADTIKELTSAVFASEAPRYTDFFPAENFELESAKRGQAIFERSCTKCHGHYDKAWDTLPATSPRAELLMTTQVRYPSPTPVVDVGTDPSRRLGMKSLERLNDLAISKRNGTIIETQKGYVPPPLVGIWARWPYFHNNSAPSLCAVLSPGPQRPVRYYAGEANDRARDFDADCNGYPVGAKTPASWKRKEYLYDATRAGLGNRGHDENMTTGERRDVIRFLQTL